MEKEALPVTDAMTEKKQSIVSGRKVIEGKLFGESVAVIICGVGKVNAACGAQLAIDKYDADTVINLGVAGALNKGMQVGSVYAISSAVQYDFDLTQLNGTPIGTLDECKQNYLDFCTSSGYPLKKLATGDRFNDSKDDFLLLTEVLKADIRDMEGGAIAQACMHANKKFKSYKIISDIAGSGNTTEQYLNNLSKCFKTLESELKNIFGDING